jgi:ABC-type nitrate/sulfonate/bicarbonate transport system substrate-binding protein
VAGATASAACGGWPRSTEAVTPVAFPERSLAYAPLLLAAGSGPFAVPGERFVPLLCDGGSRVAAAVAGGNAVAGALPLADLVAAVASGMPLVAVGALTRRAGGQLVVARDAPIARRSGALLAGEWRGARVGLMTGSTGSEALMRFWWIAEASGGVAVPAGLGPSGLGASGPGVYLERDPWLAEPRWIGFGTAEGLVAALKDGRVWAFLGPSSAAAQATLLGTGEVAANFADGTTAPDVSATLPVVLACRRERSAGADPRLRRLVDACARGAVALAGEGGADLLGRALPERDALERERALRLDVPGPPIGTPSGAARPTPAGAVGSSIFAADGTIDLSALRRYLDLAGRAGAIATLPAPEALVAAL